MPKPDAPALITDGAGAVRVSYWDTEAGHLVDYGWVDLNQFRGWTFTVYDWERFGEEQTGQLRNGPAGVPENNMALTRKDN